MDISQKITINDFDVALVVERLISQIDFRFRDNSEDLQIFMPSYILSIFKDQFREKMRFDFDRNGEVKYKGIIILSGYENKIIVAHKDYPLYREHGMYKEYIF